MNDLEDVPQIPGDAAGLQMAPALPEAPGGILSMRRMLVRSGGIRPANEAVRARPNHMRDRQWRIAACRRIPTRYLLAYQPASGRHPEDPGSPRTQRPPRGGPWGRL